MQIFALTNLLAGSLANYNDRQFFEVLLPSAIEAEKVYGVPAEVTLAQAALESGWGKHGIGDYNIFGIKGSGPAGSVELPTREFYNDRYVTINARFAKYNNYHEAVIEHGKLFHNGYYNKAINNYSKNKDSTEFLDNIAGVYATSPTYFKSTKKIIDNYNLQEMVKTGKHGINYAEPSPKPVPTKTNKTTTKQQPIPNAQPSKLMATVAIVGTIASVASLPFTAKDAINKFKIAKNTLSSPTSSKKEKASAVIMASGGAANVIRNVHNIGTSFNTAKTLNPTTSFFGKLFRSISNSGLGKIGTGIMKVVNFILPVADTVSFIANTCNAVKVFKNQTSKFVDKLKAVFTVALDAIKVAFWICPPIKFLRTLYSIATAGQLGLTLYDGINYLFKDKKDKPSFSALKIKQVSTILQN